MSRPFPPATLVQLPFPSQGDPLPLLSEYYARYQQRFRAINAGFALTDGDLWEMPLWVAHLDGVIGRDDTAFLDLSRAPAEHEACVNAIASSCDSSRLVLFSPLAQNFSLARSISQKLMREGYRTMIGGNMASLASTDDFSWVVVGNMNSDVYASLGLRAPGRVELPRVTGVRHRGLAHRPRYRLLAGFRGRVPMLRLHASHGCLFACTFCGDAWSRELHVVQVDHLREELEELRLLFPDVRLFYIGDKTFGQSPAAVAALRDVMRDHPDLQLVVQTHVMMIKPQTLAALTELPVAVVEMGFETGSSAVLSSVLKGRRKEEDVLGALSALRSRGIMPCLNVLGGLPQETADTHRITVEFLKRTGDVAWLYNIYNFVPYPLTPLFAALRPRIHDWNFAHWREDHPVVFTPYHQSVADAWDQFRTLVAVCGDIISEADAGAA